MFIVAFLNYDDIDFMKWSLGPFATRGEAEEARLAFIERMDAVDEFSAVWAGDVLELLPPDEVAARMIKTSGMGDNDADR